MASSFQKYISSVLLLLTATGFCLGAEDSVITRLQDARDLLYLNHTNQAESIVNETDTSSFDKRQLTLYYLTAGFLYFEKGDRNSAIESLKKASLNSPDYLNENEKAELDMIFGFVFEKALLSAEAAASYFKALDYYSMNKDSDNYLFCLLGIVRTTNNAGDYLNQARDYLKKNNTNRNNLLVLSAEAYIAKDPNERKKLLIQSLGYFDEQYDKLKLITLYTNIMYAYRKLENYDSAYFYLHKADTLVMESNPAMERVLGYFRIKSNIEYKSGDLKAALASTDTVLKYGEAHPGILKYTYLTRAGIFKARLDYQSAAEAQSQYIRIDDVEVKKQQALQISLLGIKYQLQEKQLEIAELKSSRFKTVIISGGLLFCLWAVFYLYRRKAKQKQRDLEKKYKYAGDRLSEEAKQHIALSREERKKYAEVILQSNDKTATGVKWQEFNVLFTANHPFFREKLIKKHPELTKSDLKYCDSILADLSIFQAEQVLGVSNSAVKKGTMKLRKKLNCTSVDELYKYLLKIDSSY